MKLLASPGNSAAESRSTASRKWIGRIRYQLLIGFLFAIVVPSVLRWQIVGLPPYIDPEQQSVIGSAAALALGFLISRRLGVFPGISLAGYVLPTYTMAFAITIFVFFFLRIDYARGAFALYYVSTLTTFAALNVLAYRSLQLRMAVVPVGHVEHLAAIAGVDWEYLDTPGTPRREWDAIVADLRSTPDDWERMVADCALAGIPVYHSKQVFEQLTGRTEIERLSENTLGSLNPDQIYIKLKQLIDRISALTAVILLSPVLLIVGLMIRLDSPGSALFLQQRVGFRAQPFTVYKFRTMISGGHAAAISETGESSERLLAMTAAGDPRITKLGRFLRRSRLDELPQLINIVRGEMSWIGPRPEATTLASWYEAELPFYHYRHIVRPGLTGWAQVRLGHVADVNEVRQKLQLDFYYIKNFSFWLDVLIVLLTIKTVLTGHGAK